MSIVLQFPAPSDPSELARQTKNPPRPACADRNPDWWFDEAQFAEGQRLCRTCAVRQACLDQALASGERLGVWGGLTPSERDALPDAIVVPLRPRQWMS